MQRLSVKLQTFLSSSNRFPNNIFKVYRNNICCFSKFELNEAVGSK